MSELPEPWRSVVFALWVVGWPCLCTAVGIWVGEILSRWADAEDEPEDDEC